MAFSPQQLADIHSSMEDFMAKRRPPEELRPKVDLAWRIDRQSVVIYSIRPRWRDPAEKIETPIAKTTYNRTTNRWKIFWMRANLKWHGYPEHPEALFLDEVLAIIDEDACGCFWG